MSVEFRENPDLKALAGIDRPLTKEEQRAVLESLPFMLVADDEASMPRLASRLISRTRGDAESVLFMTAPLVESFDLLQQQDDERTPLIFCRSGQEARQAVEILCERQLQPGLLAFDQDMGGPSGLRIFRDFQDKLPPQLTRVLQTSAAPTDINEALEEGALELCTSKLSPMTFPDMLQTYVNKTFR